MSLILIMIHHDEIENVVCTTSKAIKTLFDLLT